jgi:hypothetical protein
MKLQGVTKTSEEIKARIASVADKDWMGTTRSDLIDYLSFADAKEFLKPEAMEQAWNEREVKAPLDAAKDYLPFAWDKANGCRGLSAGRSLDHLKAWLWLAGFGAIVDEHFGDYSHYGKQQLVIASELCGFAWQSEDDGEWVNDEGGRGLDETARTELIDEAKRIAASAKESATA